MWVKLRVLSAGTTAFHMYFGNAGAATESSVEGMFDFYDDFGGNAIDTAKTAQETRLQLAQQNQSSSEGVNLDEELANMLTLQQAYNAGARLIAVSKELYDELLKIGRAHV